MHLYIYRTIRRRERGVRRTKSSYKINKNYYKVKNMYRGLFSNIINNNNTIFP